MEFNSSYTNYWLRAVDKSIDGTIIAGTDQVKEILSYLNLKRVDKILDLGCSYGRLHDALTAYGNQIYGIDPDPYALDSAKLKLYDFLEKGTAERTNFKDNTFDLIFSWAVFDVVDQMSAFREVNRILKNGGEFIITGKNCLYFQDDKLALLAEKNAYLKSFPNRFTNLSKLIFNLNNFGFILNKLIIFPRRGDMGLVRFIDVGATPLESYEGYEYLLFCQKFDGVNEDKLRKFHIDEKFSVTSMILSKHAGFEKIEDFFHSANQE